MNAKARSERWHLRQRELGACRCSECKAWWAKAENIPPLNFGLKMKLGGTPVPVDRMAQVLIDSAVEAEKVRSVIQLGAPKPEPEGETDAAP